MNDNDLKIESLVPMVMALMAFVDNKTSEEEATEILNGFTTEQKIKVVNAYKVIEGM